MRYLSKTPANPGGFRCYRAPAAPGQGRPESALSRQPGPRRAAAAQSRTNVTSRCTRKPVTCPSLTSTFCSLTHAPSILRTVSLAFAIASRIAASKPSLLVDVSSIVLATLMVPPSSWSRPDSYALVGCSDNAALDMQRLAPPGTAHLLRVP